MSCGGLALAHICAGRVVLHSCFQQGLWSASPESTGEGDTPALFVSRKTEVKRNEWRKTEFGMCDYGVVGCVRLRITSSDKTVC